MQNIKLTYLYRDAGNYKKYGEVIFENPEKTAINELQNLLESKLIDGQWFYADEWQLRDLHSEYWGQELDHGFHEFESLCYTEEQSNSNISIEKLQSLVEKNNWIY